MGCCCGTSSSSSSKRNAVKPVFIERTPSAQVKTGTWTADLFQYESIKISKLLQAKHYLIFPKPDHQYNNKQEISVLFKLMYTVQPAVRPIQKYDNYDDDRDENYVAENHNQVYPISLLVFHVKQNIINYEMSKNTRFKLTDCAYFNINMKYGELYVIIPVVKQLNLNELNYRLEVRPREDVEIYNLQYNSSDRKFRSQYNDEIRVHMQTCYACKRFVFEDENLVQQRGLIYHYDCAKYTCQLCYLEIANRNMAVLCNGMVYHKECLDIILRCSQCNRPARAYYNHANAPQLCESCYRENLQTEATGQIEAHMIKFWD